MTKTPDTSTDGWWRAAQEQRRRDLDHTIGRKLAEIDGEPHIVYNGGCHICGQDHGTIVIKRPDQPDFEICPIAFYLRQVLGVLHRGESWTEFARQRPFKEFMQTCTSSTPTAI